MSDIKKSSIVPKRMLLPFILITSLFFAWGLANNMTDTLLSVFRKIGNMSNMQTGFIQYAYFGAYFVFALPAAYFISKFSYKTAILFGLAAYILGAMVFYPASQTMQYGHFLIALFILAGGVAFLETAANPYILELGDERNATQRLNLAQSFNPIGSVVGIMLSEVFILSKLNPADADTRAAMSPDALEGIVRGELSAVMGPYVGVAAALTLIWLLIIFTKMPKARAAGNIREPGVLGRLLSNKRYVGSVAAQFFYVAAQVCAWSYTIQYVGPQIGLDEAGSGVYLRYSLIAFLISRFVCTALMSVITPARLVAILAGLASILGLVAVYVGGSVGVWALVAMSACMSPMFPTIFSFGVKGLGNDTQIGSAGIVMAIVGGAVMPILMGYLADTQSVQTAYWVPVVCFLIVMIYALTMRSETSA